MSRPLPGAFVIVLTAAALLSSCATAPDPVAPTHNSRVDYSRLMITCLADYGFEASTQGTGLVVDSHPSQREAVSKAVAECESSLGYDTISSLSEDQLGELYELERVTLKCLTELGFDVALPAKQVFIDRYYSDEFPLLESQVFDQALKGDYESAMIACPPATASYDPYVE